MQTGTEHRDILESYRMFANDRGWVHRLSEAIENGLSAEAAVERVQNDTRARMQRQTDPYIRDRLHDLDDLANRLLRALTGDGIALGKELPDNAILVARNLGPAELLEYDRTKLRGVVLEEGASISHVAIIARSLGLVAVGQAENIVAMSEGGDDIIVDGSAGSVHLRPTPGVVQVYVDKVRLGAKRRAHYRELKDVPSVTRDGVPITLYHNSGLVADLPMLEETGADGVGLFRTELQFMIASRLPRLREQVELYREALRLTGDRPIVFRLLDVGGDKVIPYMRSQPEENPAMGWRSLRLALDRPGLMRLQVRSLLIAADGRPMKILVPMVTDTEEFRTTKAVVKREVARLEHAGRKGAVKTRARGDDRSSLAALRARPPAARSRLRLDRLERPRPVPHRLRSRQRPGVEALRSHRAAAAPGAQAHRRYGEALRRAAYDVRRACRAADGGAGADVDRDDAAFDGAAVDRADQGNGAWTRACPDPRIGQRGAQRRRRWRHDPRTPDGVGCAAGPHAF